MKDAGNEGLKFEPIEQGEEDLCRALWISVIVQAFVDAGGKSSKAGNLREQKRAREWITADSDESDFAVVCDLAGLNFRKTQRRLNELLASENESLDFRCLTKAWGKAGAVESRTRFFNRARRNASKRHAAILKLKAAKFTRTQNPRQSESRSA